MIKHCYRFARPMVATTAFIWNFDRSDDQFYIVLGKRGPTSDAFPGAWCLPGGFLDAAHGDFLGEDAVRCLVREVYEETAICVPSKPHLIGQYSDPSTDPRGHVVNLAFAYEAERRWPIAGRDDLAEAEWVKLDRGTVFGADEWAFDHGKLLRDGIRHIRNAFLLEGEELPVTLSNLLHFAKVPSRGL